MTNSPIFIFAIGPRSGSTWLQRILTSTGEVLIWGELAGYPFPDTFWTDGYNWSKDGDPNDLHKFKEKKANMWMALLQPEKEVAVKAYRNLMRDLYEIPAQELGFPRWGMKQTKWTNPALSFVVEEYPDSHIIFLFRNFMETVSSRFNSGNRTVQNGTYEADVVRWCEEWIGQAEMALEFCTTRTFSNVHFWEYENLLFFDVNNNLERFTCSLDLKTSPDPEQYKPLISHSGEKPPITQETCDIIEPYFQEINFLESLLITESLKHI